MSEMARAYPGPRVEEGYTGPGMNSGFNLTPPENLAPNPFADRLYWSLVPLAQFDPENQWSLLIFINAATWAYELVEEWVRDTPDGPGWSLLLDATRCPPEALGWLGQLAGVRLLPGASEADNRARIAATDGFHRGTVGAMRAAAQATLTGNRTVIMVERDHDPADTPNYAYYLTVETYSGQTPDPAMTLRALMSQKPGGIVLTYLTIPGQTYDQVRTRFATYADLKAAYPNYDAVWRDTPP